MRLSAGRTGVCWDNSAAEAFWSSLKRELVHRRRVATRADARRAIFAWINWYNRTRLHSTLQHHPPIEWEHSYHQQQAQRGEQAASNRVRPTGVSPKASSKGQLLEAKDNLQRMLAAIPLSDDEQAAVDEGQTALDNLLTRLVDVPTPTGSTPREIGIPATATHLPIVAVNQGK